jgi:ribosomal protein S18 acetylase RimI-like enzyme
MSDRKNNKLHISKIYRDAANRGIGHGKQALDFIEQQCRNMHIHTLWLTVNKLNHIAIDAYISAGGSTPPGR